MKSLRIFRQTCPPQPLDARGAGQIGNLRLYLASTRTLTRGNVGVTAGLKCPRNLFGFSYDLGLGQLRRSVRIRISNPKNRCVARQVDMLSYLNMPSTTSQPETYLSLSELARKAGVCHYTAVRLVADGIIIPDGHVGRMGIFKASRWEELRRTIRANVIDYSTRDAARFITDATHPLNFQC